MDNIYIMLELLKLKYWYVHSPTDVENEVPLGFERPEQAYRANEMRNFKKSKKKKE